MCGVAGVFHYASPDQPVDRAALERMTRRLWHRGPDDEGFYVEGPVGLGHRRLSIVDLSPTGHQPMTTSDGSAAISYNGEFYNHGQYRADLVARGHAFRGTSDTETLLHLLEQHGPGALEGVAGIFSFAFWDARSRRLLLARDPVGVKQLYFHDDGRRIVFASEIKALFEWPDVPRELDPEAVNQYLHFHTPLFDRTFFRGIRQIRPGEYLEVGRFGIRPRTYWQLDGFEPRHESPGEAVEALRELIGKVVAEQLMSDVPVGAFFSAGIDSSAVASFAKRTGRQLRLFGIHFSDQPGIIDERPYQEQTAKALELPLDLITMDGSSFPEDLLKLSYYQDQPVIGAAMLPMFHVSRLAARHVKVCLGGQGADELFGGYARYALVHPARVVRSWFSGRRDARAAAANVEGEARHRVGGNLVKQLMLPRNLARLARGSLNLTSWRSRYFEIFARVPERTWRGLFAAPALVSRSSARDTYEAALERSVAKDPTDRVMHWEMQTYLTGLFQQDDRMSMANSLESRVPLADPRLVRFAFHTSPELKIRGGASKWVLRQAVAEAIPDEVLNRRKVGFDTPAERWMRETHKDFIHDLLLSRRARERGLFQPRQVERLLADPTVPSWFDQVWKLSSLEAWARVFLDRETPVGLRAPEVPRAA